MDLATVSERLGHSNVRVTAEIYAHAIRGRDDEAARKMGRVPTPELAEEARGGYPVTLAGALRVLARVSALPVSHRKHGSANGNRTR